MKTEYDFSKAERGMLFCKPENMKMPVNIDIAHPKRKSKKKKATLADLDSMAVDTGTADLADQHDHYLYGTPKR